MASRTIDLKAIVGLGNPGAQYSETRHNAGFWFVEGVARDCSASFSVQTKFKGEVTDCHLSGDKVWCLKPNTLMNLSGQSVRALTQFYKIQPQQMLVAHDEIDLPPGTIKLKFGGGHGGHNGLRDIISHLGTKDFYRLRIGVGHPGNKEQVPDYVLRRAPKTEQEAIEDCIWRAQRIVPLLGEGDLEKAMHELHSR